MDAMSMENGLGGADGAKEENRQDALSCSDRPSDLDHVRVAVLGTGSLGKEHVRIYAELAAAGKVEFAGIYDTVAETAQRLAQKYRVRAFGSVAEAVAARDAVKLVTP